MYKFYTITLGLSLLILSLNLSANTSNNDFYQHKPTDMNKKQWSSLKTAVQEVKLLPSAGGGENHNFGKSISVDGNRMVVGAPHFSLNTIDHGAVYVFDYDGTKWNESQILTPFDGNNGDQFGTSVSLSGTRLLIGAFTDDDSDTDSGVVFVYDFDGVSWQFTQKLFVDDGEAGDQFGFSVSLSSNRALIGASFDDDNGTNSGSAYIFDFDGNNWIQTTKLTADDGETDDQFGSSVSLSSNRALIGAFLDDHVSGSDSGSAYIFDFDGNNWTQTKLTADDGDSEDFFGFPVSLSGNKALIGAPHNDGNSTGSGSVYIFDFDGNNWIQTTKLIADDGEANDQFGFSISLLGNRVLIGANRDDSPGDESGSAYIFDFDGNNWNQTTKITASDTQAGDNFSFSASLSNNRLFIGSPFDDSNGDNSGAFYVFDKNGNNWNQSQKLIAESGILLPGQAFGHSVSLSNNRALIGIPGDNSNGFNSGIAIIFDFDGNNWIQSQKITASNAEANDLFGISVSLSNNRALIGSSFGGAGGDDSGSAYIFDFDGNKWIQTKALSASDGGVDDRFGSSVSLSSNRALIGAINDNDNGQRSGAAYIYDFDGSFWTQTEKLTAGDGEANDRFGWSVSLLGNRALISSVTDNSNTGAVFVFDFNGLTWNQSIKLIASDADTDARFGSSVSLSSNRALVGADSESESGFQSGSAYIFNFDGNNWIESQKILASDGSPEDRFGESVSLSGNRALIGAEGDGDTEFFTGSAYVFDFDGVRWNKTQKIATSNGEIGDSFGGSVSLFGSNVLIGAAGEDDRGINSGSAYIFTGINDSIFENGFEN